MTIIIIPYEARHANDTVTMWRASKERALGQVEKHDMSSQLYFLTHMLAPRADIWLAWDEVTAAVVGLLALTTNKVEQLYIHVDYQGQGIGTKLLALAKETYPDGLQLYTMASNEGARQFYERHGFHIVERGWAEEEQMADLLYKWP